MRFVVITSISGKNHELTRVQSFILITALVTSIITPALLTFAIRPLTLGSFNYLPAGPTSIIFAVLVQYHAIIPRIYKYRLAVSASPPTTEEFAGLTFSDKSYRYLLAMQLSLFQWPGSFLGAIVGWLVGYAWREGVFPGLLTRWRIPGWMVGIRNQRRGAEFDGLRRRLEGENTSGTASGVQGTNETEASRRRTVGQQLIEQVRGAF